MDHEPQTENMDQAQSAGTERQGRVRRLRWKVIAGAVACLAAIWGAITVRMASGEDPVLGSGGSSSDGASRTESSPGQLEQGSSSLPGEGTEGFQPRDGGPVPGAGDERFSGPLGRPGVPGGEDFGGGGELGGSENFGGGETETAPAQPGPLRSGQS